MKGVDVTPEQMESAEYFLRGRWDQQRAGPIPSIHGEDAISVVFEDMVRLIAWYGAIRYKAAMDGHGTLEKPGSFVVVKRSES